MARIAPDVGKNAGVRTDHTTRAPPRSFMATAGCRRSSPRLASSTSGSDQVPSRLSNSREKLLTRPAPDWLRTFWDTSTRKPVSRAKGARGVSFATAPSAIRLAGSSAPVSSRRRTEAAVSVDGSIGTEKVSVTPASRATPLAPASGVVDTTKKVPATSAPPSWLPAAEAPSRNPASSSAEGPWPESAPGSKSHAASNAQRHRIAGRRRLLGFTRRTPGQGWCVSKGRGEWRSRVSPADTAQRTPRALLPLNLAPKRVEAPVC